MYPCILSNPCSVRKTGLRAKSYRSSPCIDLVSNRNIVIVSQMNQPINCPKNIWFNKTCCNNLVELARFVVDMCLTTVKWAVFIEKVKSDISLEWQRRCIINYNENTLRLIWAVNYFYHSFFYICLLFIYLFFVFGWHYFKILFYMKTAVANMSF